MTDLTTVSGWKATTVSKAWAAYWAAGDAYRAVALGDGPEKRALGKALLAAQDALIEAQAGADREAALSVALEASR